MLFYCDVGVVFCTRTVLVTVVLNLLLAASVDVVVIAGVVVVVVVVVVGSCLPYHRRWSSPMNSSTIYTVLYFMFID